MSLINFDQPIVAEADLMGVIDHRTLNKHVLQEYDHVVGICRVLEPKLKIIEQILAEARGLLWFYVGFAYKLGHVRGFHLYPLTWMVQSGTG